MSGKLRGEPLNSKILVVEDEEHIAAALVLNLEAEGFDCKVCGDGVEAVAEILEWKPQLVVLDVMLPGIDGFEVCRRVRSAGSLISILFLTALDGEDDLIRGFQVGGDDYVTKPFRLRPLLHRIQAILRRDEWFSEQISRKQELIFGPNRVDFSAYRAETIDGKVELTQKECMVLEILVEHTGKVVSRDLLLNQIWGQDKNYTRTIDNIISRLRKHFEEDPRQPVYIESVYGAGYRFNNPAN